MTKTSFAHGQLKQIIERIERLEEEKAAIAADIKEVKAEAKGFGFDIKIVNLVLALRKKDPSERAEQEALIETYCAALGMIQVDAFDDRTRTKETPDVVQKTPQAQPEEVAPAPPIEAASSAPAAQPETDNLDLPDFMRRKGLTKADYLRAG